MSFVRRIGRRSATILLLGLTLGQTAGAQLSAATSSHLWVSGQRSQSSSGVYGYSNCTSENSLGLTNGGEIAWFQGFDTNDRGLSGDTISCISTATGWSGGGVFPCCPVGAVYVYDDPSGDKTDPTDLTGADLRTSSDWVSCCGHTDTKEPIDFLLPATVTDGFWLAASLSHAGGEFPAPMDTDTAPSNGVSWVTGDDTAFDPMNPGAGIGFFELAALGFDAHWLVQGSQQPCRPSYCTAKTGLVCGPARIVSAGIPVATLNAGFLISAGPALGQRNGLVLYSLAGRAAIPFQGGFLCVAPGALRRSVVVDSGGTSGQCDGRFDLDWNAFASGSAGGHPDPALMNFGQSVNVQWWGRDSVATGSLLSDALEFTM